jgi:putative ABC transport system ATP-binding protein
MNGKCSKMNVDMIHTRNLVKVYRRGFIETPALTSINLDIGKGEYVAIYGPSGSGKTSLFNILGLLDEPTSGEVFFMDREVSNLPEGKRTGIRRGNIGFVFQEFNLVDELTVQENIELPMVYLNLPKRERKSKVMEVLEKFRLSHKKHDYPHQLTNLQQQTVALARATVFGPGLLLADEPTGDLDSTSGAEIMDLISMVNENGISVVLFTHSLRDAQRAHRIVQIFDGHFVTEGVQSLI